jgi:tetratricopeptide (TPR) repeat protein
MVHWTFSARLLHLLMACLGRAGEACCNFRLWMVWAVMVTAVCLLAPGSARAQDEAKASGAQLEEAGDALRVQRLGQEAIGDYQAALRRGGDERRLLNKLGATELGLHQAALARSYLKRLVWIDGGNGDAWNNLGAAEYAMGNFDEAVAAYGRALKLNRTSVTYHRNFGIVLLGMGEVERGRAELTRVVDLENSGVGEGLAVHVVSPDTRGVYWLEMACVYSARGKMAEMLQALEAAAEAGVNLPQRMRMERDLVRFAGYPEIAVIMRNARTMGRPAVSDVLVSLPALPEAP